VNGIVVPNIMSFGLIAGNGESQCFVIARARRVGERVAVEAINEETDPRIEEIADKVL